MKHWTIGTCLVLLLALPPSATASDTEQPPDCEETPELQGCGVRCPLAELHAEAHGDGSITVEADADGAFDLYRSADGGDPILIGTFEGEVAYEDTDTSAGVTYTYWAVKGPALCARIDVTAIPVFPTVLAASAAVGSAGVAYIALRRRL